MYFDKEKDVVMPMHPVHYQYVKLLEELLAEAGFEYQEARRFLWGGGWLHRATDRSLSIGISVPPSDIRAER